MPPSIPPSRTLLLLIDLQRGISDHQSLFFGATSSSPALETNVSKLLAAFRRRPDSHIIHIAHHSPHPSSPLHPSYDNGRGIEFMPCAAPAEGAMVLTKHVNSAFVGTDLEERIREVGVRRLVVCGFSTGQCVNSTVRMASNLYVTGAHVYGAPGGKVEGEGVDPFASVREQKQHGEEGQGQIILVEDATAEGELRDQGGNVILGAETVHRVEVEMLRAEFCDVWNTRDVVDMLERGV